MRATSSADSVSTLLLVLLVGCCTTVFGQAITKSKYCSPTSTGVCFTEISKGTTNPVFRIAIPDVQSAPFDTILQIIAPVSLAWVGFAWGGAMVNNPLTLAWMNGNTAVVSSRWATARSVPGVYSSATVKALTSSRNATHWTAEILCTGCSKWSGGEVSPVYNNQFSFATSRNPVSQPSSPSSTFTIHTNVGMFGTDLLLGKVPSATFQAYAKRIVV